MFGVSAASILIVAVIDFLREAVETGVIVQLKLRVFSIRGHKGERSGKSPS
jgi:hypothetical protein